MAENTAIEWCDFTFNMWRGCTNGLRQIACPDCGVMSTDQDTEICPQCGREALWVTMVEQLEFTVEHFGEGETL